MISSRCALHALLGTRWALPVLEALVAAPLHFNDLKRSIPAVSSRMLAMTTRTLVAAGLVRRHQDKRTVIYRLTTQGLSVLCWSATELAVAS